MVYPQEFRENAVKRYEAVGSYWKAARELKVSIATLHRWVKISLADPPTLCSDGGGDPSAPSPPAIAAQ